jgi:hypothetical protein
MQTCFLTIISSSFPIEDMLGSLDLPWSAKQQKILYTWNVWSYLWWKILGIYYHFLERLYEKKNRTNLSKIIFIKPLQEIHYSCINNIQYRFSCVINIESNIFLQNQNTYSKDNPVDITCRGGKNISDL